MKYRLLLLLSLSGCQTGAQLMPVSDLEITKAKLAVADELRDPESARFKHVIKIQTKDGNQIICGEFNAKNGFGGYSGADAFAYMVNTNHAYIFGSDTNMSFLNPESVNAVNECGAALRGMI